MPGNISVYAAHKLINLLLGGVPFTPAGNYYVGLWSGGVTIDKNSTGSTSGEITGGSYDRPLVPNDLTHFPNAVNEVKSNGTLITFTTPTADWGLAGWILLLDAPTAGNMITYMQMTPPKTIITGEPVVIDIAQLLWSLGVVLA